MHNFRLKKGFTKVSKPNAFYTFIKYFLYLIVREIFHFLLDKI